MPEASSWQHRRRDAAFVHPVVSAFGTFLRCELKSHTGRHNESPGSGSMSTQPPALRPRTDSYDVSPRNVPTLTSQINCTPCLSWLQYLLLPCKGLVSVEPGYSPDTTDPVLRFALRQLRKSSGFTCGLPIEEASEFGKRRSPFRSLWDSAGLRPRV